MEDATSANNKGNITREKKKTLNQIYSSTGGLGVVLLTNPIYSVFCNTSKQSFVTWEIINCKFATFEMTRFKHPNILYCNMKKQHMQRHNSIDEKQIIYHSQKCTCCKHKHRKPLILLAGHRRLQRRKHTVLAAIPPCPTIPLPHELHRCVSSN